MNEELKDLLKVKKYRARELLEMFGFKLLDKRYNKRLNRCSTNDYIQRLNVFEYLEKKQQEIEEKKNVKNNINLNINKFGNNNINIDDKKIKKLMLNKDKKEKKKDKNKIITLKKESSENDNIDDSSEELNNQSSYSSSSSFMFEMNRDMLFGLKLYTYMKVVTLKDGSLFGEMALIFYNNKIYNYLIIIN